MNDAVVQDVHYGAKSNVESDTPNFTDEDFGTLINPNIVQSAPQVNGCFSSQLPYNYLTHKN